MTAWKRGSILTTTLAWAIATIPPVAHAGRPDSPITTPAQDRAAIETLVGEYISLYARPTLDRWKGLFHPALTVVSPAEDGSIRVRDLEAFFKAQKDRFETGRRISERLEAVRIDPGFRIARVSADFIFTDEGVSSRGKLGLHIARGTDGWRIVAIVFAYDPA